VNNLESSTSD